jgi:hypothetical protein
MFCLIYFVYIVCFRPIDHYVENELPENFQDIDFEDHEQQQVEFEENCSWYMLYLFHVSIYRIAC